MKGFYGIGSTLVTAAILLYYAHARDYHFFTTCVAFSQSSIGLLALLNSFVALSINVGSFLVHLVFGELRIVETENTYERFWYTVMDTGLAMTIFRNDLDSKFLLIFGFVLFLKVFHWILSDRIDSMEQLLELDWVFCAKMGSTWGLLLVLDIVFLTSSYFSYLSKGPDMMLVFSMEFAMMVTLLIVVGCKFTLHALESKSEEAWDDKGQYIFYVELTADLLKLIIYALFFSVIIVNFGLPIHMIRELYHTISNFTLKVKDLIQYRRAVQNLKSKYPNATQEELDQTDKVCIICREEMNIPIGQEAGATLRNTPKKLGCGHMFHFKCLKSWLERQQSCPTCRTSVLEVKSTPEPGVANQGDAQVQADQPNVHPGYEIPKFSSMNDLLKNLKDIAEKQGVSVDKFKIRPVEQGPSNSKVSHMSSDFSSPQTSSKAGLMNPPQQNYDSDMTESGDMIWRKLNHLKLLHQQMAEAIADFEAEIRDIRSDSRIDKGKKKMG